MREILFRGKSVIDGRWLEGYFVHWWGGRASIVPPAKLPGYVDPATVGQYTGLDDKNGKRIFEGDIIKHYNFSNNPESYSTGVILWNGIACHWERTDSECSERFFISAECKYEVIGNIHDNPELLGGETHG